MAQGLLHRDEPCKSNKPWVLMAGLDSYILVHCIELFGSQTRETMILSSYESLSVRLHVHAALPAGSRE